MANHLKQLRSIHCIFILFKSEQRWEDHPGKFSMDGKNHLYTAHGQDPHSLTACKLLCDAKPGCVAVEFAKVDGCIWHDTRVPLGDLSDSDPDVTFSYKIIASGKVF